MTRRACAGRCRGGCPGTVPRAGVGPVVRPGAGVGALEEAPAVLVVGPEAAGREDAADEAALLPSGDAQVGLQLADVVAAEVQVGLGAGVLQAGLTLMARNVTSRKERAQTWASAAEANASVIKRTFILDFG